MAAITITGSDPDTGNLTMSDNGNTHAQRGEVVTWIIKPQSGVSDISKIEKYSDSEQVFKDKPARLGNGQASNWQGRIKEDITEIAVETYYIDWKDTSGNPHQYDPKITVNP